MKHCELFGFSIPEDECSKTKSDDFCECQECTGEEKMTISAEVKAEARCSECGKKASEDKHFRFKRGKCCACISREDRAKKKGNEPVKNERKPGKAVAKAHPHPAPLPRIRSGASSEGEGKVGAGLKPAPTGNGKTIILDFSGYPELYETVTTIARDEMRTPENQVLYFLKKGDFSGSSKVSA